jgi:murein L,D-transpeptidase YcbB/YkuD
MAAAPQASTTGKKTAPKAAASQKKTAPKTAASQKKAAPKPAASQKKTPPSKSQSADRKAPAKKQSAATVSRRKTAPRRSSWRNSQMKPTRERYREIEQALASRGYFNGEPRGDWTAESIEALKRFQADQRLDADGRIDSMSLIALGLGPSRAGSPGTP